MQLQHDEPTRVSTWRAPTSLLSLSLCPSLVAVVLVLRCCCVIVVVGADFLALAVSLALTDWLVAHSTEKRLRIENSQHTKKNAGSRTHEYNEIQHVAHMCVIYENRTRRKNVASWFFNTSAQLAASKTHNCNTNEASRGRRSRRRHNTQFEISLSLLLFPSLSLNSAKSSTRMACKFFCSFCYCCCICCWLSFNCTWVLVGQFKFVFASF